MGDFGLEMVDKWAKLVDFGLKGSKKWAKTGNFILKTVENGRKWSILG
jgi:hypothetical protein